MESVYLENNREVVPKLCLGSKQNMETNPSTYSRAVQKTWIIRNKNGHRYAKICIPPIISVLDGRRLTRLHRSTYDNGKEDSLIIPRVAVETG
jgi:hypothetical protein